MKVMIQQKWIVYLLKLEVSERLQMDLNFLECLEKSQNYGFVPDSQVFSIKLA